MTDNINQIPLDQQMRMARCGSFIDRSFRSHIVNGLCNTLCKDIFPGFADYDPDQEDLPYSECTAVEQLHRCLENMCYDADTLTYGELCFMIRSMDSGSNKSRAVLLAAQPLYWMAYKNNHGLLHPEVRFYLSSATRTYGDKNSIDPEVMNYMYALCSDSRKPKFLYWATRLTKGEFLQAVLLQVDSMKINRIYNRILTNARTRNEYFDNIMNLGYDLLELDEPDTDEMIDYLTSRLRSKINDIIIEPLAELYQTLNNQN